ncbi:MAG: metallophosphoesterase, partial [Methyloceanibacter sp.]|nr:metallophosphoesterase [Methyloceanibacter sp.]
GLISDTHDNLPLIRRALAIFGREGLEVVLHTGDIIAPFAAGEILKFRGKVYAVYGNNDGEKVGLKNTGLDVVPSPRRLAFGGRSIVMVHAREEAEGESQGADIVVFGHSHRPSVEPGPPLRINPGECGGWLTGRSTIAILDTDAMTARIIDIRDVATKSE